MRDRRTFGIVAAVVLTAVVGGIVAMTGIGRGQAVRVTAVSATITIDATVGETFAPPPANAAATLTAEQAWAHWQHQLGATDTTIPSDTTVQLGLLTLPVGPNCGAECSGLTIQNGTAYKALNELVYGFGTPCSPEASSSSTSPCIDWTFIDANTGSAIDKVVHMGGGSHRPS
jgi:hypothetical protein